MIMKSFVVGCVIICAGCASLMSEEARKRMEERRKKSEEFVGLAQKYGYSGRILSSDARLGGSRGDDTKEWARKLFNCEIAPNEEECQLCYDRDGSQDNDWDSFVRYNLIKWSNENLARWGRGFKEQFAYQRTFYPQSFMEFKFRKEYSLGWREAGHAPMNVSGEESAFIVFTTAAMGLGNMGLSGDGWPTLVGTPEFDSTMTNLTIRVALKPETEYKLGFNSRSHKKFASADGVPLTPCVYSFRTK